MIGPAIVTWPELGQSESLQGSELWEEGLSSLQVARQTEDLLTQELLAATAWLAKNVSRQWKIKIKKTQKEVGSKSQRKENAWFLQGGPAPGAHFSSAGTSVLQFYKLLQLSFQWLAPKPLFSLSCSHPESASVIFSQNGTSDDTQCSQVWLWTVLPCPFVAASTALLSLNEPYPCLCPRFCLVPLIIRSDHALMPPAI